MHKYFVGFLLLFKTMRLVIVIVLSLFCLSVVWGDVGTAASYDPPYIRELNLWFFSSNIRPNFQIGYCDPLLSCIPPNSDGCFCSKFWNVTSCWNTGLSYWRDTKRGWKVNPVSSENSLLFHKKKYCNFGA